VVFLASKDFNEENLKIIKLFENVSKEKLEETLLVVNFYVINASVQRADFLNYIPGISTIAWQEPSEFLFLRGRISTKA
jgi:hypothetical protein